MKIIFKQIIYFLLRKFQTNYSKLSVISLQMPDIGSWCVICLSWVGFVWIFGEFYHLCYWFRFLLRRLSLFLLRFSANIFIIYSKIFNYVNVGRMAATPNYTCKFMPITILARHQDSTPLDRVMDKRMLKQWDTHTRHHLCKSMHSFRRDFLSLRCDKSSRLFPIPFPVTSPCPSISDLSNL